MAKRKVDPLQFLAQGVFREVIGPDGRSELVPDAEVQETLPLRTADEFFSRLETLTNEKEQPLPLGEAVSMLDEELSLKLKSLKG